MKKVCLFIITALVATSSFAQSETAKVKTMAVIPFHLLGYPEFDDNVNVDQFIKETIDKSQTTVQLNAEETTAKLLTKGINKNNLHSNTIEELASLLGVDVLLIGEINSSSNDDPNMNEVVLVIIDGANGSVILRVFKDM